MFNFFKNKNIIQNDTEVSFEIELTASVLAYEIARIDGIISDDELDVLMEELKKLKKSQ